VSRLGSLFTLAKRTKPLQMSTFSLPPKLGLTTGTASGNFQRAERLAESQEPSATPTVSRKLDIHERTW